MIGHFRGYLETCLEGFKRRVGGVEELWGGQRPGLELADLPFIGQVASGRGTNFSKPLSFLPHRDFCVNQEDVMM